MKFTGEKPPRHPPSSDATPPEEGNISATFVLEGKIYFVSHQQSAICNQPSAISHQQSAISKSANQQISK